MRAFRLFVLLIFIYLVQIIIVSKLAVFGVRADILLVFTAICAVMFGAEGGFLIGLFCGFVQDVFGGAFYIHTISKGILGFLIGTLKESILGTEEAVVLIAVFAATISNFIFELLLLFFFFGKPLASPWPLLMTLIISCLYNMALTLIFYPAVKYSSGYFVVE